MDDEIYLVIKSIDLLTRIETDKLPKNIRNICTKWCWTQTFDSTSVLADAGPCHIWLLPNHDDLAVRPALFIKSLDKLKLPLYTELEIFDNEWIYIGKNKALIKDHLWLGRFDEKSSEYKTSEIKQKLDDWLEKQKHEFEED